MSTTMETARAPQVGDVVGLRTCTYLVEGTEPSPSGCYVQFACLDDDAQGQEVEAVYELELEREILNDEGQWRKIGEKGFDSPKLFSAYVHTLRWQCVTTTNPNLFQSPFLAGTRVDAYQLEPLRKALRLPRVNIFIADDVGLGKTIEAGLSRRREIMRVFSSHGAFDQMIKLEEERSHLFSLVDELKKRLEVTNKLETNKTELTIERAQVKQRISIDYAEHDEFRRDAILIFEELSREISDHEGSLEVDVRDNGLTFKIKVEGGRSVGIRNIQIFCFDMMLSIIWAKRNLGPSFPFHDSHLFDGMDSRQVAKAIKVGEAKSSVHNFQYIITMNSDQVLRNEFKPEFEFDRFVNQVQLSDENESGGLFGTRI